MGYFTTRQECLFPSYTIDVKEQKKIDHFLQLLDKSDVEHILKSVQDNEDNPGGRPPYHLGHLLAMVLYGFAFGSGTLRDLESLCRYDLRYIYIMQGEQPDFKTICNFINKIIVPNTDEIFTSINCAILQECDARLEDVYIDGTKIEADANKYKFVWKPTTFHRRLSDKIRTLLNSNGLGRGLPADGIISTAVIAGKITQFSKLLESSGQEEKKALQSQYDQLLEYLSKSLEYEEKESICGPDRNSYYKTDHDATAMTLKADYYSGLGSNMHAAYNAQAVIADGFITAYYVSQSRNDFDDFIPVMKNFKKFNGFYPNNACADSGYGSLKNYKFLHDNHIGNYVKHSSWEGNVSGRKPDCFHIEKDRAIICLNGNVGSRVEIQGRHPKRAGAVFYKITGYNACAFSPYCKRWQKIKDEDFKIFEVIVAMCQYKQQAEANLLSVKGIELRINRSAQVEGSFGVLEQDMHYTRFRRASMKKVCTEYMLTFLGYNIRKLFRCYDGKLTLCSNK